jgi:isochorismate pyruvate lyase
VSKARAAASDQGLDPDLIEQVWRILIEWSITREAQVIRAE